MEARKIFSDSGSSSDLEDARLAVDGLAGKCAGIISKAERKLMILGNVIIYSHNPHLFALQNPFTKRLINIEYENVAEVWYY